MGGKKSEDTDYPVLASTLLELLPNSSEVFTWQFRPEPGYLAAGVYKLRVHCTDPFLHQEVYSNSVALTVVP